MTINKTVVRSIRFSEETNQLLKVESRRLGVSQNDLIRIGLRSIKNADLQTLEAAKELVAC